MENCIAKFINIVLAEVYLKPLSMFYIFMLILGGREVLFIHYFRMINIKVSKSVIFI